MSIYNQAFSFINHGISVFPVRFRDKKPAVPTWEIYQDILPTENQLKAWFPIDARNYGIVLGWQSLAVLDFDDMEAFYNWSIWQLENVPIMDHAFAVKTSRGMHVYFTLLEQLSNMKMPSIDFKVHGYTVGPGSTHPNNFIYRSLNEMCFPVVERLSDILPDEILAQASIYNNDYEVNANFSYASPPKGEGIDLDSVPGLTPMEEAKRRYRIEQFFPSGKVDRGGFVHVICPFHEDKSPSAWVNVKSQLFGCHSCNMRPMSVIGFYAAINKISIKEAIREMSK